MYHNFCIHSSTEGHPGSFQLLAIINRAAMNIVVHVSLLYIGVPLGYMPRSGISRSSVVLCPNFWGIARLIVSVYNPTNSGEVFLFLHNLASICCHLSFGYWPIRLVWGGISGLFWFAFPWCLRMLSTFLDVYQPFDSPRLKTFCLSLYPIF